MKPPINTDEHKYFFVFPSVSICVHLWIIVFSLFFAACSQLEKPTPEPFYAETAPPQKKEFRWSNGRMPKSFDPALAAAPPETDFVRAIYEGLTDTDPKTLDAVPAIAAEWTSSAENKVWTFKLRRDARWSNGKAITAADFARSWKRLAEMDEKVAHRALLKNIVGMPADPENAEPNLLDSSDKLSPEPAADQNRTSLKTQTNSSVVSNSPKVETKTPANENKFLLDEDAEAKSAPEVKLGVEAIGDYTLRVSLIKPDKDFPKLVAHPLFRPIYGDGQEFEAEKLNASIVTSGAFRIASVGPDGVTLDRAENFWNSSQIELERVKFVPTENAEKALEAYRAGDLDAVTNTNFEPLALKLLTPYDDFRRTTHSALNFYEFNRKIVPFDDRRVREALAIAIDRERLTEGDMEGASRPAYGFLPFDEKQTRLKQDVAKAKNLFLDTGFPNGENFPIIRLVINRNEMQQRIARSVAKMWKNNLNVKTEIIVRENDEIETIRKAGDFDLIRRGVVLPTTDETANLLMIFEPRKRIIPPPEKTDSEKNKIGDSTTRETAVSNSSVENAATESGNLASSETTALPGENQASEILETEDGQLMLDEATALIELPAIPLYFPTSYSLVKPYIQGFEMNTLDAPSLKSVKIDNNWQPKKGKDES